MAASLEFGGVPRCWSPADVPWFRGAALDIGTASLSVSGETALGVRTDSVLAVDKAASPPVSRRGSSS